MALLPTEFNSAEHDTLDDYSAIPAGDYQAMIEASEMKNTKDGTGKYLWLKFKIIAGQYKGRVLFNNLNLINKSEQAVEIANKALSSICAAVGKVRIKDSQELHGKPMIIVVGKKAATAQYPEGNTINNYKKIGAKKPAAEKLPDDELAESREEEAEEAPIKKKRPWDE